MNTVKVAGTGVGVGTGVGDAVGDGEGVIMEDGDGELEAVELGVG